MQSVRTQREPTHAAPGAQVCEQSEVTPASVVQLPFTQVAPEGQALPQPPQFESLERTSAVHCPSQHEPVPPSTEHVELTIAFAQFAEV